MFYKFQQKVEHAIGSVFEKYGRFIARHPLKVILVVVFIDVGLGFGLLRLQTESGIEQYTPTDSTASKNRDQIRNMFNVNTSENFYLQSLPDLGYYASVIIERKDGGNVLDFSLWGDISEIYSLVHNITAYDTSAGSFTYTDICAKRFSACVVEGDLIFSAAFLGDMTLGSITYPTYTYLGQTVYINRIIGGANATNNVTNYAKALKLTFNLDSERSSLSRNWELAFIEKIVTYSNNILKVKYAYSDSLNVELSKNVTGDIIFFSVTFTLMIIFSSLALMSNNCVANRYNLSFAGILGTGMAIVGSFGLVSLCGAKFVDIVGAMPFLILGIGVDDMFILLSGLADTSAKDTVETRIGQTMRTSGISITITSITDVIAFCAGAASVFPSVRNFSWYTGCAILFCYLNYVTYYIGCMTINEKRVSNNLHFWTCLPTKSKSEMEKDGKPKCKIFCCAGAPHKSRDEIEGPIEKYPKAVVKRVVLFKPTQIVICVFFALYLGISIWGTTDFKEGLDIRDLVGSGSYYYDFYDTDQNLFSQSLIVSLNFESGIDYRIDSTVSQINSLVTNVQKVQQVSNDFLLSWIHAYRSSALYNNSTAAAFIGGLQSFLSLSTGEVFVNDVIFDASNTIVASRIHILTESITSSSKQADLMTKIRDSVDSSSLPVFAYAPGFIFFEQYVQIFPQTIQTLAICVGVVFLVTAIFMPLPLMILLVTITVIMIMLGVIGFIQFWGLTLSSVTMINIIMCVGFCIDFSTHICHAFVQAEGTRNVRVSKALDMAGGPIFNGAISTIIGVLMLAFSSSFIFFSFFKVMFLVMIFGLIHSVFLLPVILAYIGPQYKNSENDTFEGKEITFNNKAYTSRQTGPEPLPDYPGSE
ncbi:patched domain-containing protein 3-like isoform X2 [Mytilus californianus]|uniref:patched domain-containing protein 3-like isoform X2 n=1 Tax=Mytilus californianus TaxID=6549 RepID=UPI00224626C6|nr:patched domain-containing protein 3-like isoform X2 [Mytilus californianus]XP_052071557.1 patched domain-containing protein 3-like isoform X2 [Mytilus californianus]XP_052071558.1 patched domain-containing protein 3-like isoform X2 [Mytilus californianus]XP_052071559.1 patched domain-containing protein 3-like isoform X2 [Mytilus californianus]